jgi:hypothetical protein
MKLWIDDVRPAPEGYVWCKSVNSAKFRIENLEIFRQNMISSFEVAYESGRHDDADGYASILDNEKYQITIIDIDHDAGDYASAGGDYIKLLDWMEETGRSYPIHIHSMNPVGVANMRAIIKRNGWVEV